MFDPALVTDERPTPVLAQESDLLGGSCKKRGTLDLETT